MTTSQPLTPRDEYTSGIEGPAVDRDGILYVVSLKENGAPMNKGTGSIGMLRPGATSSTLFAKLPNGSLGSGIRFDREGRMFVADHKKQNIFVFDRGQTTARLYVHAEFNQPNDLAIAADGTLYASDPMVRTGQKSRIWRITRKPDGTGAAEVMSSDRVPPMGRVNGIDLSPDGATLYASESGTNEIWSYKIQGNRLVGADLVKKFPRPNSSDLDGLRTDVDGNVYVAWNGNSRVLFIKPVDRSVQEIRTQGTGPSNLTFGGPDKMTVYVTQVDGGCIETFKADRPGREPFPV